MADHRGLTLTNVPPHDTRLVAENLPGAAAFHEPLSPGLAAKVASTRVLAVMIFDRVEPGTLELLPDLEAVITRSDGFDHLPLEWLRQRGISAYHLEGYATSSVAQMALAFLISLLRRVPEGAAVTRSGSWDRSALVGRHLKDATIGILGVGRIGSEVARILTGLGCRVVGHDIRHDPDVADLPGFEYATSLDDLLDRTDALTIHLPLTDGPHATRGLLDEEALLRLPEGAVIVNTARGHLIDTDAVLRLLDAGHLAGYAADILPGEPDPPHLALFAGRPNVLLTPHLGAHNHHTITARYRTTARIAQAVLGGRPSDAASYRVD